MNIWVLRMSALLVCLCLPAAASAVKLCNKMGATQAFWSEQRCVSSALAPQAGNRYGIRSLTDGKARTAWCEAGRGHGIGEAITLRWTGAAPLRSIRLVNGYAKSTQTYWRNSRVRTMRLTFSFDGVTRSRVVSLSDTTRVQEIRIPWPHRTSVAARLEILSVYPGSHYTDTCLSALWSDFGF